MNPKDDAGSGLKQLEFLVGKWQTDGEVLATHDESSATIKGIDTYEWILDRQFILHSADVMIDTDRTKVLEFISYGPNAKSFLMRSFDNKGTFTIMQSILEQDGTMVINGDNMRSTLTSEGNHMNASWERSEDGVTWLPWMEMKFKK